MSPKQNKNFKSSLRTGLQEAGLPSDPENVVGRLYRFGCEYGSHHSILSGTIQAIEVSDEGGFDVYVSNPRFWGARLISIKHNGGKWMAFIETERKCDEQRFFKGEFELL